MARGCGTAPVAARPLTRRRDVKRSLRRHRDARSLAFIREELAARAIHHGLGEIDAATLRLGTPRAFTQEVSRRIYEGRSARGEPFRGIRYRSRLGDQFVNWAVFEVPAGDPEPLTVVNVRPLAPHTPDVLEALDLLGLHWA